jgi:tetratricopeptide (TPR) repeat protein
VFALDRTRRALALLFAAALSSACGGGAGLRVSPAEIPDLEARLTAAPDDADARLRYAAALFAAGRCGDAGTQAEAAAALRPRNGVTPLVQGQCHEAAGRLTEAIEVYDGYLRVHPEAPGAAAVRGRRLLAERALADVQARQALEREQEISARPARPGVVAVLPTFVLGEDAGRFASLAPALAQMLVSDLSLLGRLTLVERIELEALLDELERAAGGRLDPSSAPRVGRLVRAESLVQTRLVVGGDGLELEARVARDTALAEGVQTTSGELDDLLAMEKQLAVALADRLAGPLTPAEEQAILDNGPRSVSVFLDWAEGLLLEGEGDFAAAAAAYRRAAAADPGFVDATERARAAAAAVPVIGRSPTEVVALGARAADAVFAVSDDAVRDALDAAAIEVAPLGPEVSMGGMRARRGALSPGALQPSPVLPVDVILRILVRIPR